MLAHILTAIRNAHRNKRTVAKVKVKSIFCLKVLNVLKAEGFIRGFSYYNKTLYIFLKYASNEQPIIESISSISTPARTIRISSADLSKVQDPSVTLIVSTIEGVVTDKKALSKNFGGVVLCKIIS